MTDPILLLKNTKVVLSGIADGKTLCHCIPTSEEAIQLPELESNIEEADMRLIPHSLHAAQDMAKRIIILSNDTDVLVLDIHFLMF